MNNKILELVEILRNPETFKKQNALYSQKKKLYTEDTKCVVLNPNEIEDSEAKLLSIVKETCVNKKGKVIIPAFSVDRTQELVYALDKMYNEGKLPNIKVFVDSPLSVKATEVIRKHQECYNQE